MWVGPRRNWSKYWLAPDEHVSLNKLLYFFEELICAVNPGAALSTAPHFLMSLTISNLASPALSGLFVQSPSPVNLSKRASHECEGEPDGPSWGREEGFFPRLWVALV